MIEAEKKTQAQKEVRRALRDGVLIRPETCEECDNALNVGNRAIHAVHFSYDEPLRVRWLCGACRSAWDALRRRVAPEHRDKSLGELYMIVSAARALYAITSSPGWVAGSYQVWDEANHAGYQPLGAMLRSARTALNWTQAELASSAGVSQGYLSKTEAGGPLSFSAALSLGQTFAEAVPGKTLIELTNEVRNKGGTSEDNH